MKYLDMIVAVILFGFGMFLLVVMSMTLYEEWTFYRGAFDWEFLGMTLLLTLPMIYTAVRVLYKHIKQMIAERNDA